jgi:hypothetical protein
MGPALFTYVIALLLFANAGQSPNTFLFWADWVVGVYFVIVGSLAGWQAARNL